MQSQIDDYIEREYRNIYAKHWKFMNKEYIYTAKNKYHRKKIEEIPNIDYLKKDVYSKLGSIAPYVFLADLCNDIKLPGPYNNLEKGLLLLEHLLNGYSMSEMEIYINESNFFKLYKTFYVKNKDTVNKWIDDKINNCFSSPILRLLCSKKFNPNLFENITLLLDGHHSKITYQDINLNKKDLYSYKLKTSGLNTQFIIDTNRMCLYVSNSLPCKDNTDDNMLLNININKFYYETDCICFDGLYENTVEEFILKYSNIGYNISIKNFCFPIKKDKKIDLTIDEANYNEQLGSFRSKIESYFAELSSIFKRFDPQNKIRITDHNLYNIQLKLACVLLNIKYFTELFGISENNHYNKWKLDNFSYLEDSDQLIQSNITLKTKYKLENMTDIKKLQKMFLNNLNFNNYDNYDDRVEDNDTIMSKENEPVYEIQYVITHKGCDNNREYFVKWKKFSKEHNSWVKECDFLEKDIIKEYLISIEQY
jgi:hypothetical protein